MREKWSRELEGRGGADCSSRGVDSGESRGLRMVTWLE